MNYKNLRGFSGSGFRRKVTVCQTCGGWGFSSTFIDCDSCQAYAVHVHCLDTFPAISEGFVWFCVDCEPKVSESSTLEQTVPVAGFQSRLKNGVPVTKLEGKNEIKKVKKKKQKKSKKKRKYDSCSLAISDVQNPNSPSVQTLDNLEKDETLRSSIGVGRPTTVKEDRPSEAKISPAPTSNDIPKHCYLPAQPKLEGKNEIKKVKKKSKKRKYDSGSLAISDVQNPNSPSVQPLDNLEKDDTLRSSIGVGGPSSVKEERPEAKISPAPTSNDIPKLCYLPAQPIFEAIWRGSFHLYKEKLAARVAAHLSSLACLKVCETAKRLPEFLCLELLPISDLWPKGFKRWGPNEESIALYFFPNNEREVKTFDSLVDKMIGQDLGMRAFVQDVELLVFTSTTLPLHFWRFQEKFYLWGVFRAKRASHLTNGVH